MLKSTPIISILFLLASCQQEPQPQPQSQSNATTNGTVILTTNTVTAITGTTAVSGGNITSDGGNIITERGVCWSTNNNPTITSNKIISGSGTGNFTSSLIGLTQNTNYFVRAYAINSIDTAYGNQVTFTTSNNSNNILNPNLSYGSFTDAEGNTYATIQIGSQVWMAENLKVTKYRNGDPIANVTDDIQWSNLTTGAYSNYNNNTNNGATYGKLYNWFAVSDSRNICPVGWHIPDKTEWTTLLTNIGGYPTGGGKMKSTGLLFWQSPNLDATNESGFSALPGGTRTELGVSLDIGKRGYWWSTSEGLTPPWAYTMYLFYNAGNASAPSLYKKCGLSVRCVKD
ncbi:MAG: fibrobacter succinogenes major paralogous domain-containing protein [Bacteroidetes bacterium]|nr:fibrobacter succinogenes major paralogous domain-containing protein [Bacteroidota bacterium]